MRFKYFLLQVSKLLGFKKLFALNFSVWSLKKILTFHRDSTCRKPRETYISLCHFLFWLKSTFAHFIFALFKICLLSQTYVKHNHIIFKCKIWCKKSCFFNSVHFKSLSFVVLKSNFQILVDFFTGKDKGYIPFQIVAKKIADLKTCSEYPITEKNQKKKNSIINYIYCSVFSLKFHLQIIIFQVLIVFRNFKCLFQTNST